MRGVEYTIVPTGVTTPTADVTGVEATTTGPTLGAGVATYISAEPQLHSNNAVITVQIKTIFFIIYGF